MSSDDVEREGGGGATDGVREGGDEGAGGAGPQPPQAGRRSWLLLFAAALVFACYWFFVARPETAEAVKKAKAQKPWVQETEAGGAKSTVMALGRTAEGGVLTGTTDGRLTLWSGPALDNRVWSVELPEGVQTIAGGDGLVALGGSEGGVSVVSPEDGGRVKELGRFADGPALSLDVSDDRRLVLGGGMDGTVYVWEAAGGRRVASFEVVGGVMLARFLGPTTVLTVSYPGVVERWDTSAGGPAAEPLELNVEAVTAAALAPDRNTLAAGSSRGKVVLLDLGSNRPLAEISDLIGGVWAVAFSSDGRLGICDDLRVGVYSLATQETRAAALGAGRRCASLSFAEGGGVLVGQEDGKVYRYTP